jgi:hypothetical protein
MAHTENDYIDAYDVLRMRIKQANAVLLALSIHYTEQKVDKMDHILVAGIAFTTLRKFTGG